MFESIVSEILTKYLGKFVKGLDKENLKIAIWGGDVVLKDLEVRVSALANLNLPIAIKSGPVTLLQFFWSVLCVLTSKGQAFWASYV